MGNFYIELVALTLAIQKNMKLFACEYLKTHFDGRPIKFSIDARAYRKLQMCVA